MLAQRRAPAEPAAMESKGRAAPSALPNITAPASSKKMSFKDKHALTTLPGQIEALQTEIAGLNKKLADPDLYRTNPALFAKTSAALTKAEGALVDAEERWLELELLREEVEAR